MIQKAKNTIKDFLPALTSPNFRLYTYGQGISLIGSWLATVAEQWLIYPVLTKDESLVGVISALNLLPTAALVLFAGVFADHIDKRKVSIILQSLFGLISFSVGVLVFTGQIQVWHVMVAATLGGILFAFDMPTRNALMLDLVDKRNIPSAIALNSGMFNTARAIGPAAAGFLIAWTGIASAYIINAVSFIAVIISLYYLKVPQNEHRVEKKPILDGLKEGLRFIRNDKDMIILLTLLAILSGFGWPISNLFPVYAHEIYKTGEVGFGLIQSFFGMGALTSALIFAKIFEKVKDKKKLIIIMLQVVSLAYFAFGGLTNFVLALLIMLTLGASAGILFGMINSLVQLEVPRHLRARVMSIYSFVLFGSMPIGSLLLSILLRYIHAQQTVFVFTLCMYIGCMIILLTQKDFLKKQAATHV